VREIIIPNKDDSSRSVFKYGERKITMQGNFDMAIKGTSFNKGDIICAISDDLKVNKLDVIKIKILSVSPLVMKHIEDIPKVTVIYSGMFKTSEG
jgi:transcription termination factor NusB